MLVYEALSLPSIDRVIEECQKNGAVSGNGIYRIQLTDHMGRSIITRCCEENLRITLERLGKTPYQMSVETTFWDMYAHEANPTRPESWREGLCLFPNMERS